jgi:hypothetical protein
MPLVAAVDMGYGHLRAAAPIAGALGLEITHVDRAPIAGPEEERLWRRARSGYEWISRLSQVPVVGLAMRQLLDSATDIPRLHPRRDLSTPTQGALALDRLLRRGLGSGVVERIRAGSGPLVTTFYAPAIAADRAGLDRIFCVATDSDLNRIWAPLEPADTRIQYLVPTPRAGRRLRAYGVPAERITFTGFPLPDELVGGRALGTLRSNLAARLVRLDPTGEFRRNMPEELAHFLGGLPHGEAGQAPLLTFAVGGAGAQVELAHAFLPGFRPALEAGTIRIALVAGVRPEVEVRFREAIRDAGLEPLLGTAVELLIAPDFEAYYARFNALLARTDVLWTKPSELTFYAALGLPLVLAPPVGVHEWYNRRWARDAGAGLKQREAGAASEWLTDWISDGVLAAAAWAGYTRLPKFGLQRILEALRGPAGAER